MKKTLLFAALLGFSGMASAQQYNALQVTSGFNADVIANGVGASLLSTTASMDNAEFAFISADFQAFSGDPLPDYALPVSGLIDNAYMPALQYQMAPYSSDNSLRLQEQNDFGTLAISGAAQFTKLFVLASTGSGSGTLGGTIHFSDNTTQAITSGVIPDWFYSNALPVVISGFGRVSRTTDVIENPVGNPRLYQFEIAIDPANQVKTITSIDFVKESFEEGVINIFAVTAEALGICPPPSALTVTNLTGSEATVSWTAPVILPADGYQYYISTNSTPPLPSTEPTGSTSAGVTTVTLPELTTGITYCIWVRSKCSDSESGAWSSAACFTPGQIDTTHPDDIPTLYNIAVDMNSTTTCPGIMTVNVPAGYVITSVATSYDMQTASNGWMSEQRSILVCNTTGLMESEITAGVGGTTGTYSYSRTGLDIADGAYGNVEFELRAWRTYGSSDCNTDYNRVVAGTWTVTVTVQESLSNREFAKTDFAVYPNPAHDRVTVLGNENILAVNVYNLLGQQVLQNEGLSSKEVQLNTANLSVGKYVLKITSENGVSTKSLLKN